MAKSIKKLTRTLRIFVEHELGLNARDWGYTKNTPDELHIINLNDGNEQIISKADYDFKW